MIVKTYIAKNNNVIIEKYENVVQSLDYGEEGDIDKQKYLEGHIVSVGFAVDKTQWSKGMMVRCAEFVAGQINETLYHVNADDIVCEIEMTEV